MRTAAVSVLRPLAHVRLLQMRAPSCSVSVPQTLPSPVPGMSAAFVVVQPDLQPIVAHAPVVHVAAHVGAARGH